MKTTLGILGALALSAGIIGQGHAQDEVGACLITKTDINPFFVKMKEGATACLLYTSPSPRDLSTSRMPSSA